MPDPNDPTLIAALDRQAAVLQNLYFPAQVLAALKLDDKASVTAARLFLARFREEAGQAGDGIERVLLDQLAVAHLTTAALHAQAAGATNSEFKQHYSNAAVRLVGAVCQLVSTLASYRASTRARPGKPDSGGARQGGVGRGPARAGGKANTQQASKGRRGRP
jgi:hypothetical protein